MTASEFTRSVIALACWRAAKTETHQVMLSVCMVFLNRAASGETGNLYQNCARWLAENTEDTEFPDEREPQFLMLLSKLDGVITGLVPDKTGGALWFAPKSQTTPIVGRIVATVGQMNFISL